MSLKLKNDSEYAGKKGGTSWWRWTAYIVCTPPDSLEEILHVVYHLHPTFKNPVKRVHKREGGFRLTLNGWGTFDIKARIVFLDEKREPVILTHHLEFEDPPSHPHTIPS